MTDWAISDNHFFHSNIILPTYSNRPFKHVDEMNEAMIENWNAKVAPDDTIRVIGDFSFGSAEKTANVLRRLNGTKILIEGNHDGPSLKSPAREFWSAIKQYDEFEYKDARDGKKWHFCCFHFPIEKNSWHWAARGSIMLCGHRHRKTLVEEPGLRRFDVGVDANNYAPISLDEIIDVAKAGTWKPPDRDKY